MVSERRYRGRECSINFSVIQPSNLELVKLMFLEYHFLKCEKEQFWWLQMLFFGFVAVQCWGHPSGFDSLIPRLRNIFKFTILKILMVICSSDSEPLRTPCRPINHNFENSKRKFQTLKRWILYYSLCLPLVLCF